MRAYLVLTLILTACHSMKSTGQARQERISHCLSRCAGEPESPPDTAYELAPSQKGDARSPCEKQCYAIP